MATAAAIDRVVHHSAILEFDVSSYRTAEATATQTARGPRAGGSGRPDPPEGRSEAMNPERPPGAFEDRADEEISGQADTGLPPNREDRRT